MPGRIVHGTCELCGAEFTKQGRGTPYRFCSRECGVRGRSGPNRLAKVDVSCKSCGVAIPVQASKIHTRTYCSYACRSKGWDAGDRSAISRRSQSLGFQMEDICCSQLSAMGFITLKSKASRGPFDVVAMGHGLAMCIQVKRTTQEARRWNKAEARKLIGLGAPSSNHNKRLLMSYLADDDWYITDVMDNGELVRGKGMDFIKGMYA